MTKIILHNVYYLFILKLYGGGIKFGPPERE